MSHPVRVRGLKLSAFVDGLDAHTFDGEFKVRGLKLSAFVDGAGGGTSHPVRVRGLKLFLLVTR